jgi:DNA polymerase-3 subunit epsilon
MTATLADLEIIALDCQTTGANPDKGHLLEIGWLPARASSAEKLDRLALRTYLVQLPATAAIPAAVQRITGITNDSLKSAPPAMTVWNHLAETAKKVVLANQAALCPMVIHFARFEKPFLQKLHKSCDPTGAFPFQIICTHEIAIRLLPNLPRRGIRAIAGYFGHCVPESKRSGNHAIATLFIWKKMIELLNTSCGISQLDQLTDWLASTRPASRKAHAFPMKSQARLQLPDTPGIYRMLGAKGQLLYIGKAKSIRTRVNSYFRPKASHAERTLEMLTQAWQLEFTETRSALEAAILESDAIKRHSPPYNIALRRRQRHLVFCAKDLSRFSPVAGHAYPLGPLPGGKSSEALLAFGAWLNGGMQLSGKDYMDIGYTLLGLPPEIAPELDCLKDGFRIFQEEYRNRLKRQSPLRFLTGLGARLWLERMKAAALDDRVEEEENDHTDNDEREKESADEPIWTADAVARFIENTILHSAHLIRRARWFCLLSESSLAWASPDRPDAYKNQLILKAGSVLNQDDVKLAKDNPVPPGFDKSFRLRQKNIDLITYDRLRVVTTELRRLISEGRKLKLRLGPRVTLDRQSVMKVLRWV